MRHRRLGLVHLLERHPGHGAGPHLVGESVGRLESAEGGGLLVLLSVGGGQALVDKKVVTLPTVQLIDIVAHGQCLSGQWEDSAGATGDFRPKRSAMCRFCDHKAHCPEFGGSIPAYPGWPATPGEDTAADRLAP